MKNMGENIFEKNILQCMKLKGIETKTALLEVIAKELGDPDPKDYAKQNKSNFINMLKGRRTLQYDYIVPLEKILGVSFARLLEGNMTEFIAKNDNVPYNKGFKYYAYMNDPELCKTELDMWLSTDIKALQTYSDGKYIATIKNVLAYDDEKPLVKVSGVLDRTDEFGKTFLDYVVEYNAVNVVIYLYEKYGLKYDGLTERMYARDRSTICFPFNNYIGLAQVVANIDDENLFYDIFDSYKKFICCGSYYGDIFSQNEYYKIILEHKHLFESLFAKREYRLTLLANEMMCKKIDSVIYRMSNPIINNVLDFALSDCNKYSEQIIGMLKFAIEHNDKLLKELRLTKNFFVNKDNKAIEKDGYYCNFCIAVNKKKIEKGGTIGDLIDKVNELNSEIVKLSSSANEQARNKNGNENLSTLR